MARPRKPVNAEMTCYLWEDIPRSLWVAARSKAFEEGLPMKAVLKLLLIAWTGWVPDSPPAPTDDLSAP